LSRQPTTIPAQPQETKPNVERRTTPRYPSDLELSCQPLLAPNSAGWQAQVLNISQTGIALVIERRFERGTLLTMDLENPLQGISRTMVARVVHARRHEHNTWVLGCVFTTELYEDELHAFRAERVQPAEPDGRAWVRFPCNVATVCREEGDAGAKTVPAVIVNVSPTGIGLLTATAWERGTLLRVQLPAVSGRPERRILLRVAHLAKAASGEWAVGCEIVDQLGDDVLAGLLT
jgi:PilZ domain-containing protein